MNRILVAVVSVAALAATPAFARSDVSFNIGFGGPSYYAPAPVYYAPRPVAYYAPRPVAYYAPQPAYYAPVSYYYPTAYYGSGYYGPRRPHHRGYHRY